MKENYFSILKYFYGEESSSECGAHDVSGRTDNEDMSQSSRAIFGQTGWQKQYVINVISLKSFLINIILEANLIVRRHYHD